MDNDLRRIMSVVSESDSPSENTPTHGEHFPAARPPGWSRWQVFGPIGAGLLVVGAAYAWSLQSPRTVAGLKAGGQPVCDVPYAQLEGALDKAADQFLDTRIVIAIGSDQRVVRRRDVGFVVDRAQAKALVQAAGKTGNPLADLALRSRARRGKVDLDLPVDVDRPKALEFLTELKDDVDRAPIDARLDLEHHTIAKEKPGYLLRVYDSMVAVEYAARSGSAHVDLAAGLSWPKVKEQDLKDVDISTVLGYWETRYSSTGVDSDRTYNLKVGADHLNGHILKPHEVFSFNEVVGDRTEKEGYRVAPVIQGGELIDGLAGGMCQIASTLHAASFFAGLEIVSSTPHSRPSAYIAMGLDSTVVYPSVDLKLRNPYDFPVVMHYQVNQGAVKVELLGKERPYRVIFEREIKGENPFGTDTRGDSEAPSGQRYTIQEGYPGYSLIRRRYIFEKDQMPRWSGPEPLADILQKQKVKPVKKEQWTLHYPATTQYIAVGTGPSSLKAKPQPPSHHIPPIPASDKPLFKLLK
jgi:vancomycin resistance protein YoaR